MKRFNLMAKDNSFVENSQNSAVSRKSRDTDLIIMALPVILALAVIYFIHTQQLPDVKEPVINPAQTAKLDSLKKEYNGLLAESQVKQDVSKLIEERNRLKNNLDAIKSLNLVRSIPLDLLIAIGRNISEKLALTAINKKDNLVILEGISMDNKSLSDFMDTLVSQNVFKSVAIKSTEYTDEFGPYKHKFNIMGIL